MDLSKIKKEKKIDTTNTPWYKKKISIIAMSSTLGVGVLTTAIAVPVALTSSSSTTSPTQEAIATFNKKSVVEKINAYNSIMANATNNDAIKNYFFTSGGMSQFFNENVMPVTSGQSLETYNKFKDFLLTYTSTTIIYNPIDKTNFLKMKAIGTTDSVNGNNTNIDEKNAINNVYCSQHNNLSAGMGKYIFYSPIVNTIQNVTMNDDFSITMNLSTDNKVYNAAFKFFNDDFNNYSIQYKTTIKFSNTTLFPGMSDFVKKSILNLTV